MTGRRKGKNTKRPRITTNEGSKASYVSVTAEVIQQPDSTYPIVIQPSNLRLDEAGNLKAEGAEFTITNVSDENIDLKVVYTPYGYFDLDLPDMLRSGETAQCRIATLEGFRKDNFEKSITIEVGDPSSSRFTIPVVQKITGAEVISNSRSQGTQDKH